MPEEMILNILSYLNASDLESVSKVDERLQRICEDATLKTHHISDAEMLMDSEALAKRLDPNSRSLKVQADFAKIHDDIIHEQLTKACKTMRGLKQLRIASANIKMPMLFCLCPQFVNLREIHLKCQREEWPLQWIDWILDNKIREEEVLYQPDGLLRHLRKVNFRAEDGFEPSKLFREDIYQKCEILPGKGDLRGIVGYLHYLPVSKKAYKAKRKFGRTLVNQADEYLEYKGLERILGVEIFAVRGKGRIHVTMNVKGAKRIWFASVAL